MKLDEVYFLEVRHVEAAHAEGLVIGGGSAGVRDRGLLESATMGSEKRLPHDTRRACCRVRLWPREESCVRGWEQASGRHGGLVFLEVNGYPLVLDRMKWRLLIEGVASGTVSRDELSARFAEELGDAVPLEA